MIVKCVMSCLPPAFSPGNFSVPSYFCRNSAVKNLLHIMLTEELSGREYLLEKVGEVRQCCSSLQRKIAFQERPDNDEIKSSLYDI